MSFDRMASREATILDSYFKSTSQGGGDGVKEKLNSPTTAEKLDVTCGMNLKEKKMIKIKWDEEFGRLRKEGNLFWLGGKDELEMSRKREEDGEEKMIVGEGKNLKIKGKGASLINFKQVMGDNVLGWFLPIGRTQVMEPLIQLIQGLVRMDFGDRGKIGRKFFSEEIASFHFLCKSILASL